MRQYNTDGMSARKFEYGRQSKSSRTQVRYPRTHKGAVNKAEWQVLICSTAGEGTRELGKKSDLVAHMLRLGKRG